MEVRAAYRHPNVQWGIAGLIMGNFFTNLVEKQIDPTGELHEKEWKVIENIWNSIFVAELTWNMWAHWAITVWSWRDTAFPYKATERHFLCSGWNLFDTLVVGVSVPSLLGIDLGSFSQLRMLRAFRVFRLFKRIKSLNKIIVSLTNAVPGLINAAIVQFLVMCIYAILAVDLFRDFGKDGEYVNIDNQTVPLLTNRGMTYGHEYFGNFFRSLYTLFQVLTGESWSEVVARPVIMETGANQYVGGVFFVSYIIICGIILVNVAVAVLLEKMVDLPDKLDDDDDEPQGINLADLPDHAAMILSVLDTDGDGTLTAVELGQAAELLKKHQLMDQHNLEEPSAVVNRLAKELTEQMSKASIAVAEAGRPPTAVDLAKLREESRQHDAKLETLLEAERQRSESMQQQILSLTQNVQSLTQLLQQRTKRKPTAGRPGSRLLGSTSTSPPGCCTGCSADGAGTATMPRSAAAVAEDDAEDKIQDGVRSVSKQAPDRVHQRL